MTDIKVMELEFQLDNVQIAETLADDHAVICRGVGLPLDATVEVMYTPPLNPATGGYIYLELCSFRKYLRELADTEPMLAEELTHRVFTDLAEVFAPGANLLEVEVEATTFVHGPVKCRISRW